MTGGSGWVGEPEAGIAPQAAGEERPRDWEPTLSARGLPPPWEGRVRTMGEGAQGKKAPEVTGWGQEVGAPLKGGKLIHRKG